MREEGIFMPDRDATGDWTFESSGDAYDACQVFDEIKTGDTLMVPGEACVGLAWTWPLSVTQERGNLHTINPGSLTRILEDARIPISRATYAVKRARDCGWEIHSEFRIIGQWPVVIPESGT